MLVSTKMQGNSLHSFLFQVTYHEKHKALEMSWLSIFKSGYRQCLLLYLQVTETP